MKLKICVFILSCIALNSCRIKVNEYGQPERIVVSKDPNIPDSIYREIDTLTLYKSVGYKLGNRIWEPKQQAYIRFFSKGKFVYSHGSEIELSKEYFRPARGKQGKYEINKKGQLTFTLITSGEGYGYSYKGPLKIKGDSLILEVEKNYFDYFIKEQVIDSSWLDWQPDW